MGAGQGVLGWGWSIPDIPESRSSTWDADSVGDSGHRKRALEKITDPNWGTSLAM